MEGPVSSPPSDSQRGLLFGIVLSFVVMVGVVTQHQHTVVIWAF
jgi:hypothetical protein